MAVHTYTFVGPSTEQLASLSPGTPTVTTPAAGPTMTINVDEAHIDELDDAMRDLGFARIGGG